MKKITIIFLIIIIIPCQLFAVGTPVFDWTSWIQQVEDAYNTTMRWYYQFEEIKRTAAEAEKRLKEFDPSSFQEALSSIAGIANSSTKIMNSIGIDSEFADKLRSINDIAGQISNGYAHYKDKPSYWFDLAYDISEAMETPAEKLERISRENNDISEIAETMEGSMEQITEKASSSSEIDRSQAQASANQLVASQGLMQTALNQKQIAENKAEDIIATNAAQIGVNAYNAASTLGGQKVAEEFEQVFPEQNVNFLDPPERKSK